MTTISHSSVWICEFCGEPARGDLCAGCGRMRPDFFPDIEGPNGGAPLAGIPPNAFASRTMLYLIVFPICMMLLAAVYMSIALLFR